MTGEVRNTGLFWLPAEHRLVPVSCYYQVVFERNHYVYRLLHIQEEASALARAA